MINGHYLTEKQAFMRLFGNYDDIQKRSIWTNIPFPEKETDGYFSKKIGIVSSVFFKTFKENGKKKFVLLTKTVPIDIPFECHACLPLISATIFSRKNRGWQIEAQNLFLRYAGEYGRYNVQLITQKLILTNQEKMNSFC